MKIIIAVLIVLVIAIVVVLCRIFFSRGDWQADCGEPDGSKKQHRERPL